MKPNGTKRGLRIAGFLIFAWVFEAPLLSAQAPTSQIPRHDASAVVKLITVRVVDARGRSIRDLKREDFRLFEDSLPKPITEFEVHDKDAPALPVNEAAPGAWKPSGTRKFLLFFDIRAGREFCDTVVKPGDEVAVFSYTPLVGLRIETYFTTDKEKAQTAMTRAIEIPLNHNPTFQGGVERVASEKEALASWYEAREARGIPTPRDRMEDFKTTGVFGLKFRARDFRDFRLMISDLAGILRFVAGPKMAVFFSNGEGDSMVNPRMGAQFGQAGVSVFAVNTKDWTMKSGVGTTPVKEKFIALEHPLKDFAQASGGEYYPDIKALPAMMSGIGDLASHYYVLGYYVTEKWEDRFHKIRVEADRPGSRVIVQAGYYDARPFSRWTDAEKEMDIYDLAFAPNPGEGRSMPLPMTRLAIPTPSGTIALTLSRLDPATAKLGAGKAEVYLLTFGGDRLLSAERGEIDLAVLGGKTVYPYGLHLLSPGEYETRLVVRSVESGQTALGRMRFSIPETALTKPALLPPLLVRNEKDISLLHLTRTEQTKAPALIELFPMWPEGGAPVITHLSAAGETVWVQLPAVFGKDNNGTVELTARLLPSEKRDPIELDPIIFDEREKGFGVGLVLLRLDLPAVQPGAYTIEFEGAFGAERTISRVSMPIRFL
jgi:VWFA-related protein